MILLWYVPSFRMMYHNVVRTKPLESWTCRTIQVGIDFRGSQILFEALFKALLRLLTTSAILALKLTSVEYLSESNTLTKLFSIFHAYGV